MFLKKFSRFLITLFFLISFFASSASATNCDLEKNALNLRKVELKSAQSALSKQIRQRDRYNKKLSSQEQRYRSRIDQINTKIERLGALTAINCITGNCRSKTAISKLRLLSSKLQNSLLKLQTTSGNLSVQTTEATALAEAANVKFQDAQLTYDACLASNNTASSSSSVSYNFSNMSADSTYSMGQGFSLDTISTLVTPFTYVSGSISPASATLRLEIVNKSDFFSSLSSASNDKALYPGNVNLQFTLPKCARLVKFTYFDGGGEVNLKIGDAVKSVQNFSELSGLSLSNTNIIRKPLLPAVSLQDSGTIEISGDCIKSFAFGGQESLFDDLYIQY